MSAQVIQGQFQNNSSPNWLQTPVGVTATLYVLFNNGGSSAFTINGFSITGTNASDFTLPIGPIPTTVQPGQTAIIPVQFTPGASGARSASLSLTTTGPTLTSALNGTGGNNPSVQVDPAVLFVTPTYVGQSQLFPVLQIVNTSNTPVTVVGIALSNTADFSFVSLPSFPFSIPALGTSPTFTLQFNPTVSGARTCTILLGFIGGAGQSTVVVSGTGKVLVSAFTVTGNTSAVVLALETLGGGGSTVRQANPTSINCEEACSATRATDFGMPCMEKQLMRIRGRYEDLGPAVFQFSIVCKRILPGTAPPYSPFNTPNINIGSSAADGGIHEFISDAVEITGEIIQISVVQAGNSGQVSIIDFFPMYEPKGEVVEGTT